MVIGNMQPYFFPYLGYFDLINRCDKWIVFDTPQYIKQGWVNRNRVLHPAEGWAYFGVPVKKHEYNTPICRIETAASRRVAAETAAATPALPEERAALRRDDGAGDEMSVR